jgi:hypothetical protein
MEEHLNQILMVSIVIIMIIIILNKNKNVCVKEGFLNGEPKHVPRNFELHEIDHKNKFMSFIFNSPRPYIIGNLVRKYELILVSYKKEENNKHHNTVVHIKDLENCKPDTAELHKKGKYMIKISLPETTYEEVEEDGTIKQKELNYKIGLRAIYPKSVSSLIVQTSNQNLFNIVHNFNYKENNYLLELGKEFRDKMKLENEKTTDKEQPTPTIDPQYERMAEKLGGYPDNLILDREKSLEELLKLSLSRGSLSARVNQNSFKTL